MFAARLPHEQLLGGRLVLVQHALPGVDHPDGDKRRRRKGEPGDRLLIVFVRKKKLDLQQTGRWRGENRVGEEWRQDALVSQRELGG